MRIILLLSFLFIPYLKVLLAQDNSTDRLLNEGQLPEDFTASAYDKYLQRLDLNKIDLNQKKSKKVEKKYYLESTYVIDQLLKSGYILYNDPIGVYVNQVLNVIVENNPKLKKNNPRVYVLRSTEVNAFAVDQGIIFVSIGLISQLENEAQLALILSHELVHVKEQHGLDEFLEAIQVEKSFKKQRKMEANQIDIASLEKNRYSREQEMEADDKGLDYFLNTNYSFTNIQRVFDVLRYSYLPYDEIPFELSALEKISVEIPEDYLLKEVKPINPAEEDEEQSSHPALSKRITQFAQRLKGKEVTDEKDYIVSEKTFKEVQFRARTELARCLLKKQQLSETIYTAFLMKKVYGESEFTKEVTGKALYGLAKFDNNSLTDNLNNAPAEAIEGESQQVYHLIEKLSDMELNILAIAYNFDRYQDNPQDSTTHYMLVDLFADLYNFHNTSSLTAFYLIDDEAGDTTQSEDAAKKLSKIDKIKNNKKQEGETSWHRLAFSDVLNDPLFRDIAEEGFTAGKELKKRKEYYDPFTSKGRRNLRQYNKDVSKNGYSLGVKKAILINPFFIHLKGKLSKTELDFIKSNERKTALKQIIGSMAGLHQVDVQILDPHDLGTDDVDKLNDIVATNEWIDAQIAAEGFLYQAYNSDEVKAIAEKYGTPYVMSVAIVSVRNNSLLARLFNRKLKSFVYVGIFDLDTGKRVFIKSDFSTSYISDAYLKSELYDAFFQLSKQK